MDTEHADMERDRPSGVRDLWSAVLHAGIIDADKKHDSLRRAEARRFVNDNEGMFPIICNILEIDPGAARSRIVSKWGKEKKYKHVKKTYRQGGHRDRTKKSGQAPNSLRVREIGASCERDI